MTKTQIEAVTAALRQAAPPLVGNEYIGWKNSCRAVADALTRTRKGFDRKRFLRDCGVQP